MKNVKFHNYLSMKGEAHGHEHHHAPGFSTNAEVKHHEKFEAVHLEGKWFIKDFETKTFYLSVDAHSAVLGSKHMEADQQLEIHNL